MRLISFIYTAALLAIASAAPLGTASISALTAPEGAIVVFKPSSDGTPLISRIRALIAAGSAGGSSIKHEYSGAALSGFAGKFSSALSSVILNHDAIDYIVPDTPMKSSIVQSGTAGWGEQRVTQRERLASNDPTITTYNYTYARPYGRGVTIWIIDTGIRDTHTDFGGRAKLVTSFGGYPLQDDVGHGTHCAGIAAGTRWGIAKAADIRGIKVLGADGSGYTSDIIQALNYVVEQYQAGGYRPTVISMSLGGDPNTALDTACNNAVKSGVHVVVAAGNEADNASNYSPGRATGVITVGATTISDSRASYSNYGSSVDIFAPGSSITSDWNTTDTAIARISGTSMATPAVAGSVAYYLSQSNLTTDQIKTRLYRGATGGALSNLDTASPNRLVFVPLYVNSGA